MINARENLIRALRRQNPEYVPFAFSLCDSLFETFKAKTGSDDYMDYFDMPFRYVNLKPSINTTDYSQYYKDLPKGAIIDAWGVAYIPGSMEHFTRMLHAMEMFTSPKQVNDFPLPDLMQEYRWEGFEEKVNEIKERGLAAVYSAIQIFEPAWYLRGMENFLVDLLIDEDMVKACLERITTLCERMAQRLAASGIDMIIFGDDVGTQHGMMMDPNIWRKWLKPTMERVIKAAKETKPDIIAYYHSDGNIYDIIPDLIEIGVDVLNPVQPECMDPVKVKEIYGDRLSFFGTIGTQTTMPFGSSEDVEKVVRTMISKVGKGGGLVIAPTHMLEPEVPWENIISLVNAVRKYGKYIYSMNG